MNPEFHSSSAPAPSEAELVHQREVLRRGLRRANFAWVVIVAVIAALAFGVVWKAGQSADQAELANRLAQKAAQEAARANSEAARAESELWNARFTEARALRKAGGLGARTKSAAIVAELARHAVVTDLQRLALRTEAIAQLTLVDVDVPDDMNARLIRGEPVWDASFERYAAAVSTNDVELFESKSGKLLTTIPVPRGLYREVVEFSPDGRFLAAVLRRNSSRVMAWRIEDGALVLSNQTTSVSGYRRPFFSPDSRTLAIYTTRGLELHALDTNAQPRLFPNPTIACFGPDSRSLGVIRPTSVEIWSAVTGEVQAHLGPDFTPFTVAWHPDGRRLAVGGKSGELALWEPPIADGASGSDELLRLDGHKGAVVNLVFSPDGATLLSWAWDNFSAVWDVRSGQRLLMEPNFAFKQHSADGRQVIVEAGRFGDRLKVPFLSPTGFRTIIQAGRLDRSATGAAFSPDGRYAATDHVELSRLWDARSGRELARLPGRSPVFLPDSKNLLTCTPGSVYRFATADGPVKGSVSNLLAGVEILHRNRAAHPEDAFNSLSLAPDARTLVVSARRAGVVLFDLAGERPQRRLTNVVAHFASMTPDGEWLMTQFHNDRAYLVSLTNPDSPRVIGWHLNTAFSPGGTRLAIATADTVTLAERNATNGWSRTVRVPLDSGVGVNTQLAFSPDGRTLAVNTNRVDIHLLDAASAKVLATFTPPNGTSMGGRSLAFSPDGRYLRALRDGGEVIEWDIPIVRAELAKLGLDWEGNSPTPNATSGTSESEPAHGLRRKDSVFDTHPKRPGASELSTAQPKPSPASVVQGITGNSSLPAALAGTAGLLALIAAVFVFTHQRRLLAGYAQAERLAAERQAQLDQARHALFHGQKLEALGTLAAGVAHDFNNLLSIIRMSKQLVERSVKPEGVTKENLEAIEQAVQQGKSLINSMLGYSRRPTEAIEDFPVAKVVGDTVALLSRQFLSGLTLDLQLDPSCPPIHGSRARLEQALLNLIVNASEAMQGSGTLSVTTRPADPGTRPMSSVLEPKAAAHYIELCLSDTGSGIPSAALPRIFEPFFTTKNAGMQRGTGIGLFLVYAIAKQDGWGLDVKSSPGAGTRFTLLLPASQTESPGRRLPTSQDAATSGNLGTQQPQPNLSNHE